MKVLHGIKVLDFGRFIAGPYCGALLADFGADVIRIDRVGGAEDRTILPVSETGDGAQFMQVNRNKRSLTLNMQSDEGRTIAHKLIAHADVVVANMPPSALRKLGLDYESLCRIKPDIILTASTAFGTHPAVAERVAFDGVAQVVSGAVHLSGTPEQPAKMMVPMVDFPTGMACALGTVLALYERKSSGKGQEVGGSLLRTAYTLAAGSLIEEAVTHADRKATLNRAPNYAPSDIFRVKDGWIIAQCIGEGMFKRWARMVGRPELADDPRFADDMKRGDNGAEISGIMQAWCDQRTRAEALAELEAARLPGGPVLSPREALASEEARVTGAFRYFDYPGAPTQVPVVGTPVSLSRTPGTVDRRPPLLGEHTDEILREAGYSAEAIAGLRARGVV